ncbi:MAG: hypothetical protein D6685_01520 [Bacteroidetes bacterium]|nr:MAG: hypothetical protein D6685_01520 [Bacteroidota bacterium]
MEGAGVSAADLIQLDAPIHEQAVAAGTDLFDTHGQRSARLSPPTGGTIRVTVALSAAAKLQAVVWDANGAQGTPLALNSGNDLAADALYTFVFSVGRGEQLDFRVTAAVTVRRLVAELAKGAIA